MGEQCFGDLPLGLLHPPLHPIALHLSGVQNTTVDALSRAYSPFHEIEINLIYLNQVFHHWGTPDMDVFGTRSNKCNAFCCWGGMDPRALGNGLLSWSGRFLYLFPLLPLIPRVLQKLQQEKPRRILLTPWWLRQVWFPLLWTLSSNHYLQLLDMLELLYIPG